MSEFKDYHGVKLINSEVDFLNDLEKLIKERIPCYEDRDRIREERAKENEPLLKELKNRAVQAQATLNTQYQQVLVYEAELDRQANMTPKELEKYYEKKFLETITPKSKAQIKVQLDMLIKSFGEDNPTVKQYKEYLKMDKKMAKEKARSMAEYYTHFYQLRALNKEAADKINKLIYTPTITLEELIEENIKFYYTMSTPEYQTKLKETYEIGEKIFDEHDQNIIRLKNVLGMDKESAKPLAEKVAREVYQNIQTILQQDNASKFQLQQDIEKYEQDSKIGFSNRKVDVGTYLGFVSDYNHIVGLNLFDLKLTTLPENICNLSKLKVLSLEWNKIEELPEDIGKLQALEELIFDDRGELVEFPDSFCELKNLRKLKCEGNKLKSLPENFGQLTSLTELNLYHNQLSKIPDSIGLLKNLQILSLSYNKIKEIPTSLWNLSSLKRLGLGWNLISEIPECIHQLKSLTSLTLGGNQISEIPSSIANLNSLDYLWLQENQLKEIPEEIVKMKVSSLHLASNLFTTLPYFIWQMDSLKEIYLEKNPLSEEEQEIVKNDAQTIKEYCRQRASIAIMLIASEIDTTTHRLDELIKFLESQKEVFSVFSGEESDLRSTDLVLFLATAGSINSADLILLLKKAKEQGIEVVPLKGLDIDWGDLANIDLSRELGHEFTPNDFDGFCQRVYEYIQLLKRTHNIFKNKSALIAKETQLELSSSDSFIQFKSELSRIINSQYFKSFFDTYQSYLKPQYDNVLTLKSKGLIMFFQVFSQFFKTFTQQDKGGEQA